MSYTIYHNPRCRKSRETLQLLHGNGISEDTGNLEIVLYLENSPTEKELSRIAKLLGMPPIEFTRTKENRFREIAESLGKSSGEFKKMISDEEMIEFMVANPILIERPIVIKKDSNGQKTNAVLGRPPENVLSLL